MGWDPGRPCQVIWSIHRHGRESVHRWIAVGKCIDGRDSARTFSGQISTPLRTDPSPSSSSLRSQDQPKSSNPSAARFFFHFCFASNFYFVQVLFFFFFLRRRLRNFGARRKDVPGDSCVILQPHWEILDGSLSESYCKFRIPYGNGFRRLS